jgi:biotin carboxyl carrier protein
MRNNSNIFMHARMLVTVLLIALILPVQEMSAQVKRGGAARPAARPAATPAARPATKPAAKPAVKPAAGAGQRPSVSNSGNRTNNVNTGNRNNVNINIDNSKDIHINNSRNTVVRRGVRPYPRPPYVYGGYRYRCYHPYYFHPYRPFVWGPMWHPWGFFVATLAATAIIISVADNDMPHPSDMAANYISGFDLTAIDKQILLTGPLFVTSSEYQEASKRWSGTALSNVASQYYYDQGVFYSKGDGGYTVVAAPIGAKIKTLPSGYETVTIDDKGTKNYYYGGTFYEKVSDGYKVVAPMAGTVVEHISEGGEEVKMGDVTYVKFGETYFQPIQENGKNMYEVVDVEEDK